MALDTRAHGEALSAQAHAPPEPGRDHSVCALTFGDRAARFARGAKRRAVAAEPAILALLAGALAEAVQPGTFSMGVAAGRVVADASTTPNAGDEDDGKPAGSRAR